MVGSLLDANEQVRYSSAEAFAEVFDKCGKKVMDDVLASILDFAGKGGESEQIAFDALRKITKKCAEKVTFAVVPKILESKELEPWAMRCLAVVGEESGVHFARVIPSVLPRLAVEASQKENEVRSKVAQETALTIATSIPEEKLYVLVEQLCDVTREADQEGVIIFACDLMGGFQVDDEYLVRFLEIVLALYLDERPAVISCAATSMKKLCERIPSDEDRFERFVRTLHSGVQNLRFTQIKEGKTPGNVPGFKNAAGIGALITLFRQGVMQGSSPEIRETSANAISDVIKLSTPTTATVMQLAPIIRVLGEKVPAKVKRAVLIALNSLLEVAPTSLKPLVPQLQTVFAKSLLDTDSSVRDEGAAALGRLMTLNPKVDPLVNELCGSIASSMSHVRHSMIRALTSVLNHAGKKVSDKSMEKVRAAVDTLRSDPSANADDKTRELCAVLLGAYAACSSVEVLDDLMSSCVAGVKSKEENVRDVNLRCLAAVPAAVKYSDVIDKYSDSVLPILCSENTSGDSVVIWRSKSLALFEWLILNVRTCPENLPEIMRSLVAALAIDDRDLRVTVLKLLKKFAKKYPEALNAEILKITVPPIYERAIDKKSFPVKLASERALIHLLRVKSDKPISLKIFPDDSRKELQAFVTRVLQKLDSASEDEAEK